METLSIEKLADHQVPRGSITLWWLGQTGFIVKSPGGKLVAIDPYLTNSCKAIGEELGFNLDRMVPPPLEPAEIVGVDLYAITHSHGDHLDPETLAGYRGAGGAGPYLAPAETVEKLRQLGVPAEEITMTWPNKVHTLGDVSLRATLAIPFAGDDLTHVGYLVGVDGGPSVYVTGDTGYHEVLAATVGPHKPDVLAAVINGAFRNLSPAEAARLARELDVRVAIPCHYDLFPDNCLPPQLFHTNLKIEGIGDRYHRLEHGVPFTYTLGTSPPLDSR
ncbi:MAG: MBL fold metallo-hydrolase [Planctomycetota bacterium]